MEAVMNNAPSVYDAQDFIKKFVGYSVLENKDDMIMLLRKKWRIC